MRNRGLPEVGLLVNFKHRDASQVSNRNSWLSTPGTVVLSGRCRPSVDPDAPPPGDRDIPPVEQLARLRKKWVLADGLDIERDRFVGDAPAEAASCQTARLFSGQWLQPRCSSTALRWRRISRPWMTCWKRRSRPSSPK